MDVKAQHIYYPTAPASAEEGDEVVFLARRRWFDFLFTKRRNRPFQLGSALIRQIDPVTRTVWFNQVPDLVMRGDYMMVESRRQ